ncbi:hypothetical protein BCT30_01910 [Enterovibrio norvegicus]|uniref:DUF924 family protein n=1 Tax=Enterovibrio norvegicus TaxID=188144 RepID=UPI0003028AD9|nr:DUF924 family protein [Enterovibrio norvegicus]MCC4799805.1 DUF924 domain-containing protein [Enterovibrio norvegicus]OEE64538.1 hypothetical protein A1OS_15960 [Enterovibrio norvegicus]PMH62055.1 hypothetical protein BCU62_19835 [Enterovibrio norvegicus]PMI32055.1 hypothetical protein BCU47_13540 [Enterovibrio norvegicus]PMI36273.1 hypothetical protein BCU46_14905 [Enterovibrio norvegicus]
MYRKVLTFWFEELTPNDWFSKSEELDKQIEARFGDLLEQASRAELFDWRSSAKGRLGEILVLDQFSRNIYRDTPKAFAQDPLALALAQEAINLGIERELSEIERTFMYMPYMHSESQKVHKDAMQLFNSLEDKQSYEYEIKHKEIIDRFGRYPHRNAILGRECTEEETAFLKQPGSGF